MRPATIRQRGLVVKVCSGLMREAAGHYHRLQDPRIVRRMNWLVLALLLAGSVRLNLLVQTLPYGTATSVKTGETGLSLFLATAQYDGRMLYARYREAVRQSLPTDAFQRYRGKALVIVDGTDYAKRSRRGKKGKQMQYTTKVRASKRKVQPPEKPVLSPGYVDIWAGVLLRGVQALPLVRQLCSSTHPKFVSQNLLEEAVIWSALAVLNWEAILIADRGFRRKAWLVKLLRRSVLFVIRLADNIHVLHQGEWRNILETARSLKSLGAVTWKEGKAHARPCEAVVLRARLREAPGEDDPTQPNPELNLVVLFPLGGNAEPLLLATPLPIQTLTQVREIVRLYEWRWAIETMFENLKRELHLDEFMVRDWLAIERLLWAGAMSYMALLVLRLTERSAGQQCLKQVLALLRQRAVMGKQLTVGKVREALALDYQDNKSDCWAALQTVT
jgi:Transposase DDE domain